MTISIQNTLDKANALLVIAQINGTNLIFDIDTGTTYNVIFDFVYDHFKDNFENTDKTMKLFGIDGKYSDNKVVKTQLCFEGLKLNTEFQVVEANEAVTNFQNDYGVQLHGILGVQFLKDNNCVLDFANKTIKIGD